MSTTVLPLFWDLSSASTETRINASVKLVSALEHFQSQYVPCSGREEDEDEQEDRKKGDDLEGLNAQDVSYSIRRLIRGLASPRESSRLGFAVALTELLSKLNTVTCSQIVTLIVDSSKTQGSLTGQEERDMLFARLFGLTSVIQSGLLLRETPLPTSASSSTLASSLESFKEVLTHLLALGEKKSWLRESAWWTIGLAMDALYRSSISWKEDAIDAVFTAVYAENKTWTPEKLALTLKIQTYYPSRDWRKLLSPTFKQPELLSTGNFTAVARILKESSADDDEDVEHSKSGSWKPQVHFVWDMFLDAILSPSGSGSGPASFPDFFRIVVDESLFATTSSPERKYWGFQIFRKTLPRASQNDMPMLFTKNFMRSWINHLSNSDRYLHKVARQVAADIHAIVKNNPTIGFTLILQLTGINGSRQFDKLTKTKTVESILTSMDNNGIQEYIDYVLKQVNDDEGSQSSDALATNNRRGWIIDQLAALIRNGAVPKDDLWVQSILDWLVVHGLFLIRKKSDKSPIRALHTVPSPPFADQLRRQCRERLLSCLAELTGQLMVVNDGDGKASKLPGVASDGTLWVERVLSTIQQLEGDTKHVAPLVEVDDEVSALRAKAREVTDHLRSVSDGQQESAKGAKLLLSATLLHEYCTEENVDSDTLQSCIDGASRMFPRESKKHRKKSRKSTGAQDDTNEADATEPVDLLVDNVIGFLERSTAYLRAVANQVFSMLSASVKESTIELILTQLERRDPSELLAVDEDDIEDAEASGDEDEDIEESSQEEQSDDEDEDEEEDAELRAKIEQALRINGVDAAGGESEEESEEDLMDDDQMLAIDEQLAAVFRARKKHGKDDAQREATHFKNRVLDLLDTFIKKQPSSPLVAKVMLPLVDLILDSGRDEKHLADKVTGILRSRLGKSKEILQDLDKTQAKEVLEDLHARAWRAPSSDILATISQCCVFMTRTLHHMHEDEIVVKSYRASLEDFVTRKASKLNAAFFLDLVRRHADVAWGLRDDLIQVQKKAVNAYRRCQAFQILHTLVNQLSALDNRKAEMLAYFPALRAALHSTISDECSAAPTLTPAQIKELLKLSLLAVRQTKRIASTPEEVAAIWDPSAWKALGAQLAAHGRFKSSTNLQSMCKQITQMTSNPEKNQMGSEEVQAGKRKASTLGEQEDGAAPVKAKRKKVKKVKNT